ncbi:MAG: HAD hydrolase family protein [Candidatus Humimicrobiaceae bacterium]|jgi:YrbI family 3-deoxy-D-manno-octulosonate 8-phosphate phosphatase|nr:HAD hydrolase family protein [Actinomycetota bacterium]MDD5601044.1 HAD hydrolase family protein [Actinomycetota bacterium]MDY0027859.1 HAD hydrolase family protein [Candidatus Humimicrobiaceae bacterium]
MKYKNKSGKIVEYKSDIKLVIMDADGVLTDGSVYVDNNGNETLKFSRIDGKGIELLRKNNILTGIISEENASALQYRAEKLKIDMVSPGTKNKKEVYAKWKEDLKLTDSQICVCGDDISDLPILRQAGFSCAPANALDEVKSSVDYVSKYKGGEGFVREICNIILNGGN